MPDPGQEGAHHVVGAVGEVDDVEKAEDDRQPEAEDGVERAVDQPDQQLADQGLHGDAEDLGHGSSPPQALCRGFPAKTGRKPAFRPARGPPYFFTSGHALGQRLKASSAGMVCRIL